MIPLKEWYQIDCEEGGIIDILINFMILWVEKRFNSMEKRKTSPLYPI